jgi:hypothetical protein
MSNNFIKQFDQMKVDDEKKMTTMQGSGKNSFYERIGVREVRLVGCRD